MKISDRYLYVAVALVVCVAVASQCVTSNGAAADPRGDRYAGAPSCRQCHQAIYDSFVHTAHFTATALANEKTILGSFAKGQNVFVFDSAVQVRMEKRDSGFYQVMYVNGKEELAHPFDIVFGNRKGQTSLYWLGNNVFQLPVSFYTSVQQWGTSPGFSIMFPPDFSRMIGRNCFECHSSYIKNAPAGEEAMLKNTLVYGIDCERCHGPAAEHVSYHLQNPSEKKAQFIADVLSLNTRQKNDACALCHAGNDMEKMKSRFLFKPGDDLADYFKEGTGGAGIIDVHGNQHGLLEQSKCFMASTTLTCLTCHDPHTNAGDNMALYSQKCMSCHPAQGKNFCTLKTFPADELKQNCIGCHMPQSPSGIIDFQLSGDPKRFSYNYTDHLIAVYTKKKADH